MKASLKFLTLKSYTLFIRETKNKIKKITNRIYAIFVAVPATPPSPSKPAMIAMIKNVNAQFSMLSLLYEVR